MALECGSLSFDSNKNRSGLIFDTEGTTLIGNYPDELTAYRVRRKWAEVLKTYFLLDATRDYELKIHISTEDCCNVLVCSFTSACGRYAFWRLINHQAPDAEQALGSPTIKETKNQNSGLLTQILGPQNPNSPWVISSANTKGKHPGLIKSALGKLNKLF